MFLGCGVRDFVVWVVGFDVVVDVVVIVGFDVVGNWWLI